MGMPKSLTVLIDSREKLPLLFPARLVHYDAHGRGALVDIVTDRATLAAGDYALRGYEAAGLVERKGSAQEVIGNLLTRDRRRATVAFRRLVAQTRRPALLLDFPVSEWFPTTPDKDHGLALCELMRLASVEGLTVLLTGKARAPTPRRRVGELVLRFLVAAAFEGDPRA